MEDTTLDTGLFTGDKIRPNERRAKIAQTVIWVVMSLDVLAMISSYMQFNLLKEIQNFEYVTNDQINANDIREMLIALISTAVMIVSAVTFIQWYRRAYYNLHQRTKCVHTEGWAAGCWFVPIMSLFRPYQIMKEMWEKTSNLIYAKTGEDDLSDNTVVIGWWWGFWIASNVIGNYVTRTTFRGETIEDYINVTLADMVLSVLGIPLAIITVKLIKDYNKKEVKLLDLELNSEHQLLESVEE